MTYLLISQLKETDWIKVTHYKSLRVCLYDLITSFSGKEILRVCTSFSLSFMIIWWMDNGKSRPEKMREREENNVARQTGRKSLTKARRKGQWMSSMKWNVDMIILFIYEHHVFPFVLFCLQLTVFMSNNENRIELDCHIYKIWINYFSF